MGVVIAICIFVPGLAGGFGFEVAEYANVSVNVHRPQFIGDWGPSITNVSYETKTVWVTWSVGPFWFWESFDGTLEVESLRGGVRVDGASATFSITEWGVSGKDFVLQVKLGEEGSGEYTIIARTLDKYGSIVGTDQRVVTI